MVDEKRRTGRVKWKRKVIRHHCYLKENYRLLKKIIVQLFAFNDNSNSFIYDLSCIVLGINAQYRVNLLMKEIYRSDN